MKITAIETQKKRRARVNVFVDGHFVISLGKEVAAGAGLRTGKDIDSAVVESLAAADALHSCYLAAANLLSYRPRSESELRQRLARRDFEPGTIDRAISSLKEKGLLDDAAFARFWKESRENFNPRSRRLVVQELRRKGVALETAQQAARALDDDMGALKALQKKMHAYAGTDFATFRRRAGGFLARRGFNYGVIKRALERAWSEQSEQSPSDTRQIRLP